MLKTPAFWLYMIWVIFMNSTGLLVINSAASIAAYFGAIASLGMIVSMFNGFARIGIGVFFDHFGSKLSVAANTCCSLLAGLLLLTAALTGFIPCMFIGLIIAGISYGSTMALNASVIKDLFGAKHFGVNFSVITLSGIPSSILGPYVSGLLQDQAGGSYTTTFIAMCIFSVIAFVLFFLMRHFLSVSASVRTESS